MQDLLSLPQKSGKPGQSTFMCFRGSKRVQSSEFEFIKGKKIICKACLKIALLLRSKISFT